MIGAWLKAKLGLGAPELKVIVAVADGAGKTTLQYEVQSSG